MWGWQAETLLKRDMSPMVQPTACTHLSCTQYLKMFMELMYSINLMSGLNFDSHQSASVSLDSGWC